MDDVAWCLNIVDEILDVSRYHRDGPTRKAIRAAAERIAALERALAVQLALCPGCGGDGREPDTGATCWRCGAERAVLDGTGGQGDG